MRLGQLARKLAVRPSEIVEFLAANNISLDESSNTRLEDDQVILIMKQFAATGTGDAVPALITFQAEDEVPLPAEGDLKEQTEEENKSQEYLPPSGNDMEEKAAVIKAPKVELSGLKVVGKIDLPELKKKEPSTGGIESTDENRKKEETRAQPEEKKPSLYKKERTEQRPARKNPIALQREREAQEAEKMKLAKAEQEKEQRTKNYHKKVRVSAPTKRIKMVEEPTTEMSAAELKETPRTWVGKFLSWLKT